MHIKFSFTPINYIQYKQKRDDKSQTNPINNEMPDKLATPNSEILKAYNNVVSFSGKNQLDDKIKDFSKDYRLFPNNEKFNNAIKYIVFSFDFTTGQFVENKDDVGILNTESFADPVLRAELLSRIKSKTDDVLRAAASHEDKCILDNIVKTAIFSENIGVLSDTSKLNKIYKLVCKNLNAEQIAACLSFDISSDADINNFITIQKSELKKQDGTTITLSSTEAAIFAKKKFTEEKINKYLEIKSSQEIPYTDRKTLKKEIYKLSSHEMRLLAERGFDTQKINRYVQIKTLPIEIEGVRQQARTINLTTEQALDYAETDTLDDEIKAEFRLYELIDKGIDMSSAALISQSKDLIDMLTEVDSEGTPLHDISYVVNIAKLGLTDKQQIDFYESLLKDSDIDDNVALKIAKEGKIENLQTYKKLLSQGLSVDDAIAIANNEKHLERYEKLLNSQIKTNIKDVAEVVVLGFDSLEEVERYRALKQSRPNLEDVTMKLIAQKSSIFALANLKDKQTKKLVCSDNDISHIRLIEQNPSIPDDDFIRKFESLRQCRPDLTIYTLAQAVNNPALFTLLNLRDEKTGNPVFSASDINYTNGINRNLDIPDKEFIDNIRSLKQNRKNMDIDLTIKLVSSSLLFTIANLRDEKTNEFICSIDDLNSICQIERDTNIPDEDFIRNFGTLKQSRPNLDIPSIAKIVNDSSFFTFANLKNEEDGKQLFSNSDLIAILKNERNNQIDDEEFINNIKELSKSRPNLDSDTKIKVANNHSIFALANLENKEDGKQLFSDSDLSFIDDFERNPKISDKEFIKNIKTLKQDQPNLDIKTLIRIANEPSYFSLANLIDEETNFPICDTANLDYIVMNIKRTSTVSDEDFINNFKFLHKTRPQENNISKVIIANNPLLFALANLRDEKTNKFIYSFEELYNISDIKRNPDVSDDDYITNYKELKQNNPTLGSDTIANLANEPSLFLLANLKNSETGQPICTNGELYFISGIKRNPNVLDKDFICNFEKLNKEKPNISKVTVAEIANSPKYNDIVNIIDQGVEPEVALKIASEEKYSKLIYNSRKLTPKEVAFLTLHTSFDNIDLTFTSKLGQKVLRILNTGVTSNIVEAFCIANKNLLLGKSLLEDLSQESIPANLIHIMPRKDNVTKANTSAIMYDKSTYRFSDGVFTFDGINGENAFSVELKKTIEDDKTLLVVTNKEKEDEQYISYKGVIARVKLPELVEKDENGNPLLDKNGNFIVKEEKHKNAVNSLKSYARLCPEQAEILSDAAQNFIVNIFEDNGECIIGKGLTFPNGEVIKPIDASNLTDKEIEAHYKNVLPKIADNVSIENILKLMPQNAMISINPYTTDDVNILYSIGVEWMSKEDNGQAKLWKMRVHTQDLKFLDDSKNWIYRLGYQKDDKEYYYNPKTNDFEMGSTKADTHVEAKTEDKNKMFNDTLIANPHFQNIVRQIKVSQDNENFNLGNLAQKLGIQISNSTSSDDDKKNRKIKPNEEEALIHLIIDKCYENVSLYTKYKDEIDSVLAEFGINLFKK